jgi:hypothetical protein
VTIALPRRQHWQRRSVPALLLALGAVTLAGAVYARIPLGASWGGVSISSVDAPSVSVHVSPEASGVVNPIRGTVDVTAGAPLTLQELTVSIFPSGARRPGVDEAAIRTRSIVIPLDVSLAPGASSSVAFTWDQRADDGSIGPRGDYVVSIRLISSIDRGEAHATLTSAGNEPSVSLR